MKLLSHPRITRFTFDQTRWFYRWLNNTPLWRNSLSEMTRHFPPSGADLRVVDVGCGPGNSALHFLERRPDLRVIGLDFSAGMMQIARQAARAANQTDRADWMQADATRLPLPDSSVDAITGHSVFYMLSDRAAFLREAMRVLRPGGRLILLDPASRSYLQVIFTHWRRPRAALSMLLWHTFSQVHQRFTLQQMADYLTGAGFARVLTERAVEGFGILSRGEKPYPNLTTVERIAQTADKDGASDELQAIDSAALPTIGRGRFVFLLVKQTPDKPAWAVQPGESLRWDAAMVTDQGNQNRPYLLAFTSLPKAVEFMQPAVTSGLLIGINKVAKFDKAVAPRWSSDALLNPPFDVLRLSGRYSFNGTTLPVDPTSAVTGDE